MGLQQAGCAVEDKGWLHRYCLDGKEREKDCTPENDDNGTSVTVGHPMLDGGETLLLVTARVK